MSEDKSQIIVEMGPGENPFVELLRADLVSPSARVLLADKYSRRSLQEGKEAIFHEVVGIETDVSKKFLADESVDLVFAKDVLSDPKTTNREQMLKIWLEAVKENGKLVIFDVGVPTHREPAQVYSQNTQQLLEKAGWEIIESYVGSDANKVLRFGQQIASGDSVAFIARKPRA
ncbi:MAG: hypothetical protein AAB546_01380 [Patescibacteria group bacterium]